MDKWALELRIRRSRPVSKLEFIKAKTTGKRVLDLGCVRHNASFALSDPNWLHAQIKEVAEYVLGVDYLAADVEILRKHGYDVLCADVTLPLQISEQFDVIVAGDLIEHLANFDGFIRNLQGLLKPDGTIILSTPNPFFYDLFSFVALKKAFLINPEHTCWIDPQALSQLFQRYGFAVAQINYLKPSWRFGDVMLISEANEYDILRDEWVNDSVFRKIFRVVAASLFAPIWSLYKLLNPMNSAMTSCSDYIAVIERRAAR